MQYNWGVESETSAELCVTIQVKLFVTVIEWRVLTNDTGGVGSILQFSFISKPIMNTFHNIWLTSSALKICYPHWTADQTINTVL